MNAACRTTRRMQGAAGWLATCLLCAALLALLDAFRGGFFGNQGLVELLPGETRPVSGPMPPDTKNLSDIVVVGEPEDGSVRLAPGAHFSGFWFGGDMWRGRIEVAPEAKETECVIMARGPGAAKQNPTLVFRVRVWPDKRTRNAHSPSFITRTTGLRPFVCAGVLALCGLAAGALTFVCGRRLSRLLAALGCAEVYRVEAAEGGLTLFCELPPGATAAGGTHCRLYRPNDAAPGTDLGAAVVRETRKGDALLLAPPDCAAKIGDIVCFREEAEQDDGECLASS